MVMAGKPRQRAVRIIEVVQETKACLHGAKLPECRKCLTSLLRHPERKVSSAAAQALNNGSPASTKAKPRKHTREVPDGFIVVQGANGPYLRAVKKTARKAKPRTQSPKAEPTVADILRREQEQISALLQLAEKDPKLAAQKAADMGIRADVTARLRGKLNAERQQQKAGARAARRAQAENDTRTNSSRTREAIEHGSYDADRAAEILSGAGLKVRRS